MKKVLQILLILLCAVALLIVVCDLRVRNMARGRLYDDVQALPHEHAALLLGTSSRLRGGSPNPFFEYRMDAAAELFEETPAIYSIKNFALNEVEGTGMNYASYVSAHLPAWTNIETNLGFFWADNNAAPAEPDWENLDWATLTQKKAE